MPAKLTSHQILSTLARPTRPTPRLAPEGPRAAAQPLDPVAAQAANRAAVQALGRPAAAAPACRWRTTLTVTSRSCGSCRPCRSARRLGSGGNTASGPAAPTMASGSEVSGTAWEGRPGQTAPSTSASGGGTVQRAEAGSSMQTGTSTLANGRSVSQADLAYSSLVGERLTLAASWTTSRRDMASRLALMASSLQGHLSPERSTASACTHGRMALSLSGTGAKTRSTVWGGTSEPMVVSSVAGGRAP
mmetsp:Transcript_71495/g.213328  ORF Transcript_71495/g.213328 Transcript_71495/m.213328 type:complete len:247 (+) Transcript_71495:155-895(+)